MKRFVILLVAVGIVFFVSGNCPAFPISGLEAYYHFNQNADDISGNGNDGVVHGASGAGNRFGDESGSLSFDGTTDYVDLPLAYPAAFSVFTWVRSDNWSEYDPDTPTFILGNYCCKILLQPPSDSEQASVKAVFFPGGRRLIGPTNQETTVGTVDPVTAKKWHHIGFTFDQGVGTLYLDGKLQEASSPTGTAGNLSVGCGDISIGVELQNSFSGFGFSGQQDNYMNFIGRMDNLRIYSRVFTASDVLELYQVEK